MKISGHLYEQERSLSKILTQSRNFCCFSVDCDPVVKIVIHRPEQIKNGNSCVVARAGFRTTWLLCRWSDSYNPLLKPPPGHEFPWTHDYGWFQMHPIELCLKVPSFTVSEPWLYGWALLKSYFRQMKVLRRCKDLRFKNLGKFQCLLKIKSSYFKKI